MLTPGLLMLERRRPPCIRALAPRRQAGPR